MTKLPPTCTNCGESLFTIYRLGGQPMCWRCTQRPHPVPFKKVGTMRVRFKEPTPMKPRKLEEPDE